MQDTTESHPYSRSFQSNEAAASYDRKFDNSVDHARHEEEVAVIGRWARGGMFDCSIATGRFIRRLPKVTRYAGMDYSQGFLTLIRARFPDVAVKHGNLLQNIDEPDAAYDTVMCLRTLSALGHVESILKEACRIAKPGGVVVFDYGAKPERTVVDGQEIVTDGEPVEAILATLPVRVTARIPLDGFLGRIKRWPLIATGVHVLGRIGWLRRLIRAADRLVSRMAPVRTLYICERR